MSNCEARRRLSGCRKAPGMRRRLTREGRPEFCDVKVLHPEIGQLHVGDKAEVGCYRQRLVREQAEAGSESGMKAGRPQRSLDVGEGDTAVNSLCPTLAVDHSVVHQSLWRHRCTDATGWM